MHIINIIPSDKNKDQVLYVYRITNNDYTRIIYYFVSTNNTLTKDV
jgi:hypothetical protein